MSMQPSGRSTLVVGAALFLSAALGACQSAPPPDQMSRTTAETAPADLQLLCADTAARSSGVESSKVLPTNSQKLDAKTYRVDLSVSGTSMNCTVDDSGNVISVTPA
jgi:hypothetical protein